MAIDVYLQIDGIKGESSDSTHAGWIEVSQAQWGVTQPVGTPGSATGWRTTGRSKSVTMCRAIGREKRRASIALIRLGWKIPKIRPPSVLDRDRPAQR